uniref:ComF family protein n=1 Tax=Flavobacterium sp. TaxID=239 RepID=UPI00404B4FCE
MLKALLTIFYPRICLSCQDLLLPSEDLLCAGCYHQLAFTNIYKQENNSLHQLFFARIQLNHASSILYFQKGSVTQKLIHNLKYKGKQEVGTLLANLYQNELIEIHQIHKFDVIIPIPLHKKRLQERGYNQLTTFCVAISEILKIPLDDHFLLKNKNTKTQTKKDFSERLKEEIPLFSFENPDKYKNKHILLIDDVITTGSTLENALKTLSKIENASLSVITMACTIS